jgi:hypothetical protein
MRVRPVQQIEQFFEELEIDHIWRNPWYLKRAVAPASRKIDAPGRGLVKCRLTPAVQRAGGCVQRNCFRRFAFLVPGSTFDELGLPAR